MRRGRQALLLLALVSSGDDVVSLVRQSQLAFLGTVERVGATTEADVPFDDATAIVRVDQVLRAPELFQGLRGRRVTVQLRRDLPAKSGDAAVFFTRSWFYGESLGVVEVGRRDADQVDALPGQIREAEKLLADEKLSERTRRAQLIVLGTVTGVGPAHPKPRKNPFTEHDPDWWLARIAVERVIKGNPPRRLQVLFADSVDEMWIDSPKLAKGQTAILLLQRDQQEKGMPALRRPGWTALDPLDVQPASELERVRRLSESPLSAPGKEDAP